MAKFLVISMFFAYVIFIGMLVIRKKPQPINTFISKPKNIRKESEVKFAGKA